MEAPARGTPVSLSRSSLPGADVAAGGVTLTWAAAERVKAEMHRSGLTDQRLRLSAVGSGCSQKQYSLAFDPVIGPADVVFEQAGVKIVVDRQSLENLASTVIDYVRSLHGDGFKFFGPDRAHACGCASAQSEKGDVERAG